MKTLTAADAANDVFDISAFKFEDIGTMTVRHPNTDEPTTWEIYFAGPSHAITVAQNDEIARRASREAAQQQQTRLNGKKVIIEEKNPEETRRSNAEYFANRMTGWSPVKINGAMYEFTRENAVKLLIDPAYGRLYTQCIEYLADENSFTKRSATT